MKAPKGTPKKNIDKKGRINTAGGGNPKAKTRGQMMMKKAAKSKGKKAAGKSKRRGGGQ